MLTDGCDNDNVNILRPHKTIHTIWTLANKFCNLFTPYSLNLSHSSSHVHFVLCMLFHLILSTLYLPLRTVMLHQLRSAMAQPLGHSQERISSLT